MASRLRSAPERFLPRPIGRRGKSYQRRVTEIHLGDTSTTSSPCPSAQSPSTTAVQVRTEFVFGEIGHFKSVRLCGDWNGWNPIDMELEQEGTWSIVTVVPSGYREFCYQVDGKFAVSRKHPTNSDGSCNWRTVYGPPTEVENAPGAVQTPHWFVLFALNVSDSIERLIPASLVGEANRQQRKSSSSARDNDVEIAYGKWQHSGKTHYRRGNSWIDKPLRTALIAVISFSSFTLLYMAWNTMRRV